MNTNQQCPPIAAAQPVPITMQTSQFPKGIQAPHQNEKCRKSVRRMAIAEVVLGCLCFLGGIISIATARYQGIFTLGEGIWCGIWIIVAGAIGIPSGGKNSNRCLVTCHMIFSIVGAVFSCTLFGISITLCFVNYRSGFVLAVLTVVNLTSFASMILLIISASFCCYLTSGCCEGYEPSRTQVIYVATSNQQPIMMQQPGMPAQGYVIQGYQPAPQMQFQAPMMVQQPVATGSYQPPVTPVTQNISTPQTKEQESSQVGQPTGSFPPSYSRI